MSGTYSTTITTGIELTVNPSTITATGVVTSPNSYAVQNGGFTSRYTLFNYGIVAATTNYAGVNLGIGGEVVNAAGATILGATGVQIEGYGTLLNAGTIMSNGRGYGAALELGTGSNASTGLIAGYDAGLSLSESSTASFVNSGTIYGTGTVFSEGVEALSGGTIVNTAGALIEGLFGIRGATSVTNAGTVIGRTSYGIEVGGTGSTVSNAAGALIATHGAGLGNDAIFFGTVGVLLNAGTITDGPKGSASDVFMYGSGGYVRNEATGLILSRTGQALNLESGTNTVVNAGQILAPESVAVDLNLLGGGSVINLATGTLAGLFTAVVSDARGFVTNAGTIAGTDGYGVSLETGGTLINSGVITGNGTAAYLGGSLANRVVLQTGAAFGGILVGGTTASNTLELAAGSGTLASGFANFASITFDAGADWTLLGSTAAFAGQVSGFAVGDTLALSGLVADGGTYAGGVLTLTEDGADVGTIRLGGDVTDGFTVLAEDGETVISVACFRAGTRIATAEGETAIEALRIGDRVRTAAGMLRPIKWIGRRSYDGRFIAARADILPIRIQAGALADGVPARDLDVSPKHALYLDDALIPAELLVNGISIRQVAAAQVDYVHIELESHDVLLAEGAPSESFTDCDSRMMFQNAAEFFRLYPDDWRPGFAFCAPRHEEGEQLQAVRRRLAARAGLAADHVEDADTPGPLDGRIDACTTTELSGWAFDPSRPHTPVRLEVVVAGTVVATILADRPRPDLHAAGKGRSAFRHVFAPALSPSQLPDLVLRRAGDLRPLASAIEGRIDLRTPALIAGWAFAPNAPAIPVRLEVVVDGVVIGGMVAAQYRSDLAQAGKGDGRCGFVFDLPRGVATDAVIGIRPAGHDGPLARTERVLAA